MGIQGFVSGRVLMLRVVKIGVGMGGGVKVDGEGWEFSLFGKGSCFSKSKKAKPCSNIALNPSTSFVPCLIRYDKY